MYVYHVNESFILVHFKNLDILGFTDNLNH